MLTLDTHHESEAFKVFLWHKYLQIHISYEYISLIKLFYILSKTI